MTEMCEIRFDDPATEVAVLDGYCSATGKCRTDIMRAILKSWSDAKLRESVLICRVSGVNPSRTDDVRKVTGS